MASKVRVTCSDCGDQEVDPSDVIARVCVDTHDAEYHFTCEVCDNIVVKPCNQEIVDALRSLEVVVNFWTMPRVGPRVHIGADITDKDVLDFRDGLDDDSRFESALSDLIS